MSLPEIEEVFEKLGIDYENTDNPPDFNEYYGEIDDEQKDYKIVYDTMSHNPQEGCDAELE